MINNTTGGVMSNPAAEQKINIVPGCNQLFMSPGLVSFDFNNDTIYDLYINFSIACTQALYDYHIPPSCKLFKASAPNMSVGRSRFSGMVNIYAVLPSGGRPLVNVPANQLTVVGYAKGNYGPPVLVAMNRITAQGSILGSQQQYRTFLFASGGSPNTTNLPAPPSGQRMYVGGVDITSGSVGGTAIAGAFCSLNGLDTNLSNIGSTEWVQAIPANTSWIPSFPRFSPPLPGGVNTTMSFTTNGNGAFPTYNVSVYYFFDF